MAGDEVEGTGTGTAGAGAATVDPLALEAQVCFALSAGARGMVALYRPLLEPLGITHPQYLVLLALWQDDAAGATSTVGDLAGRLHLDAGTLSPLLKRLEALGYVRRSRSPDDGRQVRVTLTAEGRARRRDAERIPPAIVAATGLGLDELAEVHAAASKVVAAALRAGVY